MEAHTSSPSPGGFTKMKVLLGSILVSFLGMRFFIGLLSLQVEVSNHKLNEPHRPGFANMTVAMMTGRVGLRASKKLESKLTMTVQNLTKLEERLSLLEKENDMLVHRMHDSANKAMMLERAHVKLRNLHFPEFVPDGKRVHEELLGFKPMTTSRPNATVKPRLLLSIPVSSKPDYVRKLIDNVAKYTDNRTRIVVSVSANGPSFLGEDAEYVASHPKVLLNRKRLRTGWCANNLFLSHMSNFRYGTEQNEQANGESFTHFMLLPQNFLFFRGGMEDHVFSRNISSSFYITYDQLLRNEDREQQQTKPEAIALLQGISAEEYLANMKNPQSLTSQFAMHEGSFYPAQIVAEVVNLMITDSKKELPILPQIASEKQGNAACMEEWVISTYAEYHHQDVVNAMRLRYGWSQPVIGLELEVDPQAMKRKSHQRIHQHHKYSWNIGEGNAKGHDMAKFKFIEEICPECNDCVERYKDWLQHSVLNKKKNLGGEHGPTYECWFQMQYWDMYFGGDAIYGYKRVPTDTSIAEYKDIYEEAMNPRWTMNKTVTSTKDQRKVAPPQL